MAPLVEIAASAIVALLVISAVIKAVAWRDWRVAHPSLTKRKQAAIQRSWETGQPVDELIEDLDKIERQDQ